MAMGQSATSQRHTCALPRPWYHGFRSIQFKASALAVLLMLVVATAGTLIGLRAMSRVLYANESVRTGHWARSIASEAARSVIAGDTGSLQERAAELVGMDGVAYVLFAEADGRVLAASERVPGLSSLALSSDRTRLRSSEGVRTISDGAPQSIEVVVPITADASDMGAASAGLGVLCFATDITDTRGRLHQVARQMALSTLLGVALLMPICLLVTRRAIAPIQELVRAAHALADGSMDARATVHARDEVGTLAESFNTMAARITESQMELLKLNAELEERVQQRTQDLEDLAARDPLTGLYNRRYFGEVITREFAAAERYGEDLTCLMFDLDHFKLINDRFGHRTGDGILITLGSAIAGELRGSDVAARFGGDEFILLLPKTPAAAASKLADRIVAAFMDQVSDAHPGVNPTLSIGVASLRTTRAPSSEALIHEADVALYAAKEAGRNQLMEAGSSLPT